MRDAHTSAPVLQLKIESAGWSGSSSVMAVFRMVNRGRLIPFWARFCFITFCIFHFGQRSAASEYNSFTNRVLQYASTAKDAITRRATPLLLPLHQGFLRSASQLAMTSPLRRNLREARMWLYGHVLSQG